MTSHADAIIKAFRPTPLAYCDYIAACIFDALKGRDPQGIITDAGHVKSDLHPIGGYLLSTKKTIEVKDRNGRAYRVTVEEAR